MKPGSMDINEKMRQMFPNREAIIIFALYIILFVFQGVFIQATKTVDGTYEYNTTVVVFLSELVKLCISAALYTYRRENKPHLFKAIYINHKLLFLYFIPSLLYCFYNNLAFINLSHYDPTTYYILLQFRVVITAILFQSLFKRQLTYSQWISLGILTVGCMIKNIDSAFFQSNRETTLWYQIFSIYFLSINFQNFCSCLAGTYNEYLLKTQGSNVDIFLQNVFMYLDSVICNLVMLMVFSDDFTTIYYDLSCIYDIMVLLIIINSAVVGIVTSFFLKNLNSILKTYASALELIITAVVCYILFNIVITAFTIISIFLVSIAVLMYFKNPVTNSIMSVQDSPEKPLLEIVSK